MAKPSDAPDGWWLAVIWVTDERWRGQLPRRGAGRRPTARIRRSPGSARRVSGALSGMILEDDGRLQMRLGLIAQPDDQTRPWRVPLAIRVAFRFEPARVATMRPNELAETVLTGFVGAIERLNRP